MYTTLIVALITAIAAIAAPVITQWIAQRNAVQLKKVDLFFTEKTKAYKEYLDATSTYSGNQDLDVLKELNRVTNIAMVYSSDEVGNKLSEYMYLLINTKNPDFDAIADAHIAATKAIRSELLSYDISPKYK